MLYELYECKRWCGRDILLMRDYKPVCMAMMRERFKRGRKCYLKRTNSKEKYLFSDCSRKTRNESANAK